MPLASGKSDGAMVPKNLATHHGQRLALSWVCLSGHDRGAKFVAWQDEFAKPRPRSGAKEPDIVCDLEKGHGSRVDGTVHRYVSVVTRHVLELVRGAHERHFRQLRNPFRDQRRKLRL